MGNPLTFISYGGAFCLSTGAIHFYNILIKIFKINIKDVEIHSNLYSSNINPRSKKYKTFGGVVNLLDGKKKEQILSLIIQINPKLEQLKHLYINFI